MAFPLLLKDSNRFIRIIPAIIPTLFLTAQASASGDEKFNSGMFRLAETRCGGKSKGIAVLLVFGSTAS